MKHLTNTRRYRLLATLLLTQQLVGCYHWSVTSASPREAIQGRPAKVRITQIDPPGTRELSRPWIERDSVFSRGLSEPIALSNVARVRTQEVDTGKTVGTIALTLVGVSAFLIELGHSLNEPWVWSDGQR